MSSLQQRRSSIPALLKTRYSYLSHRPCNKDVRLFPVLQHTVHVSFPRPCNKDVRVFPALQLHTPFVFPALQLHTPFVFPALQLHTLFVFSALQLHTPFVFPALLHTPFVSFPPCYTRHPCRPRVITSTRLVAVSDTLSDMNTRGVGGEGGGVSRQ